MHKIRYHAILWSSPTIPSITFPVFIPIPTLIPLPLNLKSSKAAIISRLASATIVYLRFLFRLPASVGDFGKHTKSPSPRNLSTNPRYRLSTGPIVERYLLINSKLSVGVKVSDKEVKERISAKIIVISFCTAFPSVLKLVMKGNYLIEYL